VSFQAAISASADGHLGYVATHHVRTCQPTELGADFAVSRTDIKDSTDLQSPGQAKGDLAPRRVQ
jgi:hypothetical protein